MELKDYQTEVLKDLSIYLQTLLDCKGHLSKAFTAYWQNRGILNQKYKNNIGEVPHVCVKVPTAGGKTFIAVNAIDRIFTAFAEYNPTRPKFVVWLVPSLTILDQTVKNLADIDHPYRQRLNDLFGGRVQIYEKADVLQGADFSADTVREQLSVVVMTFDSLKDSNKENRKAFKENGYLASFLNSDTEVVEPLKDTDPSALINVMRSLKPVVVVDESHNAETPLSVDMLRNLNPSFIFDLTATPRDNSNIISYVDALRLKKQNMVKLPVIVANQRSQEEVIMAALNMRRQLEEYAKKGEEQGAGYIRPIVLFQAEPKNKEDTTTFEKVKQILLDLNIPSEHIAIKTASINELKNVDLMDRECPVRYIITINALKEGWDCPFAYVLATLANKSSVVDVTQILGRVLRMPYTRKHDADFLNLSYVFTASSQFQNTLNQVVAGLNKAGFSKRDYRELDLSALPAPAHTSDSNQPQSGDLFSIANGHTDQSLSSVEGGDIVIDKTKLNQHWESQAVEQAAHAQVDTNVSADASSVEIIKEQAIQQAQEFEAQASQAGEESCPEELKADMNEHKMKPMFEESAQAIQLPQFYIKLPSAGGFFDSSDEWHKLAKENLLTDFVIANRDANVSFSSIESEVYSVDAEDIGKGESSPEFKAVKKAEKERLNQIIKSQSSTGQIKSIVELLFSLIGKNAFYPIDDNDIKQYITRIVQVMDADQRADCLERDYAYVKVIKEKIRSLANEYAAQEFSNWLTTRKVILQNGFSLPPTITPSENAPAINKSLYVTEASSNATLETPVIKKVAELDNIIWWHRNLERGKGFVINGFLNHYPDFIVLTKNKSILIIETKGQDRDNSDSKFKLKLGKAWEGQANQLSHETGYRYHYIMIFEKKPIDIDDALTLDSAIEIIKQL